MRIAPGFSLTEMLVALVIMGTLAGGLSLTFRTSLDAHQRMIRAAAEAEELRGLLSVLRADIEQAELTAAPQAEEAAITSEARAWFIGTDENDGEDDTDTLRLTTRSHRVPLRDVSPDADWESQPRHADWSAVTYGILPPGDDGEGGLYRREQIPPCEDSLEETGSVEVLSPAVSGISFRYFDGTEWQDAWDTGEQNVGALPRAVEVILALRPASPDGEPRSVTAVFPVRLALAAPDALEQAAEAEAAAGGSP